MTISKKTLFIAYHPADVQMYASLFPLLREHNCDPQLAILDKEGIMEQLAINAKLKPLICIRSFQHPIPKIVQVPLVLLRLLYLVWKTKPNKLFSVLCAYTGLLSFLSGIKYISWTDTEIAGLNNRFGKHFASKILVPVSFRLSFDQQKEIRYPYSKELLYVPLHDQFKNNQRKRILIRTSAFRAFHDLFKHSPFKNNKKQLTEFVKLMNATHEVIISNTENCLPPELEAFRYKGNPSNYLFILAQADLYFGEGTTTAAEAAFLNVPWICVQPSYRGYLEALKEKSRGCTTDNFEEALQKAETFLSGKEKRNTKDWRKDQEVLRAFFVQQILH